MIKWEKGIFNGRKVMFGKTDTPAIWSPIGYEKIFEHWASINPEIFKNMSDMIILDGGKIK